ncbi:cell wall-binding repeat-containing protein [Desulfosporosinus sp. FKA]|uniref:cell wall-binding repeat-containing protein n=1 Tax=Desulfosporosinus sp. FKA TaxID=1969834 RepID=UPI000B49B637|nr:cell wall-binding repeat-containing protein [Desulfosporosinus sp. FKA]
MKKFKSMFMKSLILSLIIIFTCTLNVFANTSYTRIAGQTRYDTASQIATSGWQQSDYAILCYGENYPDALASAPLAKKYNAPILLTMQNSLPDSTKQTLTSLGVKNVIIIGGTGVISSNIDSQLQSMSINVSRVFGNDKYETAVKVAQQVTSNPSSIFVCTGDDFADALSVAPIASIQQSPIILVPNDSMPSSVSAYISSHNISKSYIIGFSDVISDSIANQFPNFERITGSDKYARNITVDQYFNSVFSSNGCGIATGENFADALSATAYCAKIGEPLVLANFNSPNDTRNYFQQRMGDQSKVYVFGGTAILPDSVISGLSSSVSNINDSGNSNSTNTTDSSQYNQSSPSSFTNPYPLNVPQTINVKTYSKNYTAQVTIEQIIRGQQAWDMIHQANMFNKEPKNGYEYLLAKIKVNELDISDNKALSVYGNFDFTLVSQDGKTYDSCSIVNPSPSLETKLYKGASDEGWAAFLVRTDDLKPMLSYGTSYDGSGGIWFKAYNDSNSSTSISTSNNQNNTTTTSLTKISSPIGSILCPSGLGFNRNSADGIKVYWMAKNQTGKIINYYTVNFSMYNAVGDPACDEINGNSKTRIKTVGPVPVNNNLIIYSIVSYNPTCSKIVIDSIDLQYADGTTETISYGMSGTETLTQ